MNNKFLISITTISMSAILAFSHGTEKHDDTKATPSKKIEVLTNNSMKNIKIEEVSKEKDIKLERYKIINHDYLKNIKPIFQAKCFNCHSNNTSFPFYYKIPGIKSMIDKDIKEAKKHIDFSDNFPFISHETPINDLKSLKKIAREGGMPPLKYIVAHWDSKLTKEEKKALLDWTKKAIDSLTKKDKD